MKKYTLKDLVVDHIAFFDHYSHGELWYVIMDGGWNNFYFPVPLSDLGTTRIESMEKASLLMHYIRKHIENLESGEEA